MTMCMLAIFKPRILNFDAIVIPWAVHREVWVMRESTVSKRDRMPLTDGFGVETEVLTFRTFALAVALC